MNNVSRIAHEQQRTLGVVFAEMLHRYTLAEVLQLGNAAVCLRNLRKLQLQ